MRLVSSPFLSYSSLYFLYQSNQSTHAWLLTVIFLFASS